MFAHTIHRPSAVNAFNLEDWVVEPQLNRVSNGEISIRLEPKAMEVLLCLAEHAGEVVARKDLVDTVWATEFIADSTVTHTVADLRRAFADDARQPRFIETIPKRGYRLLAEPEIDEPSAKPAGERPPGRQEPLAIIIDQKVRLGRRGLSDFGDHFLFFGDQEIPLMSGEVFFGRSRRADIRILAPEVSRFHARLEVGVEAVAIEDLGSKNGTVVNDAPIERRVELNSGDNLCIGPTPLVYRSMIDDPTRTRPDS